MSIASLFTTQYFPHVLKLLLLFIVAGTVVTIKVLNITFTVVA